MLSCRLRHKTFVSMTQSLVMMRRATTALLVLVLFMAPGCNILQQSPDSTATQPTGNTISPTSTPTETSEETPKQRFAPENRVIIDKWYDGQIRLEMYGSRERFNLSLENGSSGIDPKSVTYPPDRSGDIHVREFVPDGYVVMYVDGAVAWEGSVSPWTHFELVVRRDGTVNVREATVI